MQFFYNTSWRLLPGDLSDDGNIIEADKHHQNNDEKIAELRDMKKYHQKRIKG